MRSPTRTISCTSGEREIERDRGRFSCAEVRPAIARILPSRGVATHTPRETAATTRRRWVDELPAGWRVVGRLLYCQLPHVTPKGSAAGFAEMDDDFEF